RAHMPSTTAWCRSLSVRPEQPRASARRKNRGHVLEPGPRSSESETVAKKRNLERRPFVGQPPAGHATLAPCITRSRRPARTWSSSSSGVPTSVARFASLDEQRPGANPLALEEIERLRGCVGRERCRAAALSSAPGDRQRRPGGAGRTLARAAAAVLERDGHSGNAPRRCVSLYVSRLEPREPRRVRGHAGSMLRGAPPLAARVPRLAGALLPCSLAGRGGRRCAGRAGRRRSGTPRPRRGARPALPVRVA